MGAAEEAFIRFVIITDFLRYHIETVGDLSIKYAHLLSGDNEDANLSHLLETYEGVKAVTKPEKGFRGTDIRFFQTMKARVMEERRAVKVSPFVKTEGDEVIKVAHDSNANQFVFHYPLSSHQVKLEASSSCRNKKRKALGNVVSVHDTNRLPSLAMSLDVDELHSADCNAFPSIQI
jgi:hypothetical protein